MTQATTTLQSDEGRAAAPPMGRAVRHGMLWNLLNTVFSRGLSFLCQYALALLLSPADFGVYAVALSFAMITQVLQDAGVRQILVQRSGEYRELSGPVFWMAATVNIASGLLLLALSPIAAVVYHDATVMRLLWVLAATVPLWTPSAIFYARLLGQLRYKDVARIQVVSALVRYSVPVVLAWRGAGVYSFVAAWPMIAVIEGAMGYVLTRERPWTRHPEPRKWPELFGQGKWVLVGSASSALFNFGSYMVLGLFVDHEVVGVYYFAFQLVTQITMLLALNMHSVLFPALSRLAAEPERLSQAVLRSLRVITLAAAPASLALWPLYPPLESLLWHGRWAAAAGAVSSLGLFYAVYASVYVVTAAQLAKGWFRAWGLMLLALGIGQTAASVGGGLLGGTPTSIAIWAGAFMAGGALVFDWAASRPLGIGLGAILAAVMPAWLIAIGAALATVAVRAALPTGLHPLVVVVILASVFPAAFGLGARIIIPGHVRELLNALPARLGRPMAGLLLLRDRA